MAACKVWDDAIQKPRPTDPDPQSGRRTDRHSQQSRTHTHSPSHTHTHTTDARWTEARDEWAGPQMYRVGRIV